MIMLGTRSPGHSILSCVSYRKCVLSRHFSIAKRSESNALHYEDGFLKMLFAQHTLHWAERPEGLSKGI